MAPASFCNSVRFNRLADPLGWQDAFLDDTLCFTVELTYVVPRPLWTIAAFQV